MNCNTTHYRANSSSVPGDPTFGVPTPPAEADARKLALGSLGVQLARLEPEWRPTIICLGGDLAWSGQRDEFALCGVWLNALLQTLRLPRSAVVACPGNHDARREMIRLPRPDTDKVADDSLSLPMRPDVTAPFHNYESFCRDFGIPPLNIGDTTSQIVGIRKYDDCILVSLNTAWFCRDQDDRGQLWLGYPLLAAMSAAEQLASQGVTPTTVPPTIALLHHPFEWLHGSELNAYGRPNTRDYLAQRAHLILTGHTHGEPRIADRIAGAAYHLGCGAAYASAYYPNAVNLIRLLQDRFEVRSYQYDFRDPTHAWIPAGKTQAQTLLLAAGTSALRGAPPSRTAALGSFRKACGEFCAQLIESRSRLLTPDAVPHLVEVRLRFTKRARDPQLKDRDRQKPAITLADAMADSRRLLVTGDLGSGKTTITARLVSELSTRTGEPLAIYVPARALALDDRTTADFLESLSRFASEDVGPALTALSLSALLDDGVETVLVVDGIDEVGAERAKKVLHFLDRIVASWPNTTAVATTRPVEAGTFDLAAWDVVSTAPMDYSEWRELFTWEARAAGSSAKDSADSANALAERVRRTSALTNLAGTPLGARLLARSLLRRGDEQPEPTLGDLLYDLVDERVWAWANRASRPRTTQLFERILPDATSRSRVLGHLALLTRNVETISLPQAQDHLSHILAGHGPDASRAAHEAVEFFVTCGLLDTHKGMVAFSWKALNQFLVGIGMADAVRTKQVGLANQSADSWREVAFAVTALRRWGVAARDEISAYLFDQLAPTQGATQACYVVAESNDSALATTLFRQMPRFGWRPLLADWDEWLEPARVVAQAMTLAGDDGFEWFFREYLTPEDPWIHTGSKLPEDVFKAWAILQAQPVTPRTGELMDSLVRPHVLAQSAPVIGVIPHVVLLRPTAFSAIERAWFLSQLLEEDSASSAMAWAELERMARGGFDEEVGRVLEEKCWRSPSGGSRSVALWFELFDRVPPVSILRAAVSAERSTRHSDRATTEIEKAEERIGLQKWLAFCRWSLLARDARLAAGAALELNGRGEARLRLIGRMLVGGLHDGGYIERAEQVLHRLVHSEGNNGVLWLVDQMEALGTDTIGGSHSALWRILLDEIDQLRPESVPDAVTGAVSSLGSFILPRYGAIRLGLRRVISEGTHSAAISRTLYELLNSAELRLRHNAAALLLAAGERGLGPIMALVDALSFEESGGSWWEWQDYFVSLPLEPSALSALRNTTHRLPARAAEIVLRLLRKNGVTLTREELDRFVTVSLDRHWNFAADTTDGDARLRAVLEQRLREGSEAAGRCLFGNVSPDTDDDIDSHLLTLDGSFFSIRQLIAATGRMRAEPEFAARIRDRAARLSDLGKGMPLLELMRSALKDPLGWDMVIWRILGGGERMLGLRDDDAQVLLRIGREFPDLRDALAAAAARLLADAGLTSRNTRARQWLILLSDEFDGRSLDRLRQALHLNSVNDDPIRAALITRFLVLGGNLDTVPRLRPDGVAAVPNSWKGQARPSVSGAELAPWVSKRVWDSEGLDDEFLVVLDHLFAYQTVTPAIVTDVSGTGARGTLLAATIAACCGFVDEGISPTLILKKEPFPGRRGEQVTDQVFRGWTAYLVMVASVERVRTKYLRAIDGVLHNPDFDRTLLLAAMHELGARPSPQQLSVVVTEWPTAQTSNDGLVISAVLSVFSDPSTTDDEKRQLQDAIGAALSQFAAHAEHWGRNSVLRQLGLPLLQWIVSGPGDDGIALEVFAQGFVSTLKTGDASHVGVAFDAIAPLVARLKPEILVSMLRTRMQGSSRLAQTVGWLFRALVEAAPETGSRRGPIP